ncbi:MAG: HisA/HisF-related TIM barrel protein, partial [Chloroflexota bacterium]
AGRVRDMGVQTVIFTNIDVDATMAGPNLRQLQAMRDVPGLQLIASGGVGSVAHLRQVARLGVDGCIVGKALYEGAIDLARALHEVQGPAPRYEN